MGFPDIYIEHRNTKYKRRVPVIIVGYQGIGKSSLAKNGNGYIDLESSNFYVNGSRSANWYIPYCNIAKHLSEQGYVVFVSSHECVRRYLSYHADGCRLAIICPSLDMKDLWIEKLLKRYHATKSEKNYRALMNAANQYEANVGDLINTPGFEVIQIHNLDYDLRELIEGQHVCDCFHEEYGKTVCYGTREREECSCGGNKRKCNFYRTE